MANKALRLFNIVVFIFLSHSTASHGGESVLENSFWGIAAKAAGVSAYDLYGIALQETKMRWGDGSVRPWPWTLVLNGPKAKSLRYGSKEETARALASFVAHGITNIDIGLMQVNWKYNGHKYVRSATDLVDPLTNVIVAAHVLRKTIKAAKTKNQGIGHYHSWTPWRSERYASRVGRYSEKLAYVYQR
jgi:hypothetical protein